MNLIKIGTLYINLSQVTELRDTGLEIEIFFQADKATTLRGADAEKFRRWLDTIATDLTS
jgi:hypothetical protein